MTNQEKMNELLGDTANKEQITNWAYMNRIHVSELHFVEEFETMEKSVEHFMNSDVINVDEFTNWSNFLDSEYVEEENK